ncbi:flagellar filament capping protein FliD [Sanguibacter suaedae]|uniref:Flagellar hook-associated protein 2 n=1 Tax=Sanguibacter suaedae TaxID=2795737 RepID=A0A934M9G5_9MICO|nr:flagellar filament capping protein FliD [Sanguibacter suaedae]MBI9114565.1 flagellar filament capping protein FliD [Sanguibacter suaedae]
MAGMGIDGLASGLDTTALISQLMQVEAMPQTLLKASQTKTTSIVAALQSLNTKVASLAEAATKATKPASWDAYTAASSSVATTAKASATAQPGSVSFTVDQVASTQITVTGEVKDDGSLVTSVPPALTIKKHDGTLVSVKPTTGSLSDIAKAINDSPTAGVKASVVRVSGGAEPTYRLQLTGTETGTTGSFEVYAGSYATAADLPAGGRLDATQVRASQDAKITLWKGVPNLEKSFAQASNTFSGLMTGVDVTVTKVTAEGEDPTTITVARDDAAVKKLASSIVGTLGVVFSDIASRTATTTTTGTDGRTVVTGGLLSGDSAVRSLQQRLQTAASYPVDGSSPSEVGIVIGRDGTFTFDEAKFTAALAADPAKTQKIVSGIAKNVAEVATQASDKVDGSLTKKITNSEGTVKTLGDQISDWDRRLEIRRTSLQRTYSALEVAMSSMQSKSSWLASQLSSLPSYS